MAFGELTFSEEEAHLHSVHKNLELVSCSGHGQASSLCIFHRNINPTVFNSFSMSDCVNMWTVSCRNPLYQSINIDVTGMTDDNINGSVEEFDKFLFISKKHSTMVLACGEELQELEHSDFYTDGSTVAVGKLLSGIRILQVYAHGVRLFDQDGKLTQLIENDGLIVFASIIDPYVLLLLDDGNVNLMKIDDNSRSLDFHSLPTQINEAPTISCCIYRDDTNLFALVKDLVDVSSLENVGDHVKSENTDKLDDDDELDDLYASAEGTSQNVVEENRMDIDDNLSPNVAMVDDLHLMDVKNSRKEKYWCALYRQDGSLEIYKLPEFEEVFNFPHFDLSPAVLADFNTRQNVKSSGQTVEIQEILLINIGHRSKYPYLIARSNVGDIIIYKAFRYVPGTDPTDPFQKSQTQGELVDRLAVRFSRVPHEYISRETIYSDIHDKPVSRKSTQQETNEEETNQFDNDFEKLKISLRQTKKRLIPFTNISGYTGVFVTGVRPLWLICAHNNYLRVHPMSVDNEIKSFTQFHNVHCLHGFLYANNEDVCRLSELPKNFKYDMEWPVRKIMLHRSVHGIEYHPEMQVYALLSSSPVEFLLKDENGESIEIERDSAQFLPETLRFTLELISPVTWETVDRHELQDDEQGLCIKCVSLQTKSTSSGRKSFIAIGTGFFRGEDVGMRGNVYVFEIIEVVPEPDNPQTNHKYKLLCHEEVKGSVTAICDVNGYLLTCVGPKIFIRAFEDNDRLISVAFIDIQIYANSAVSIKDYILLGDVYKSVWFLGFQEEPAKLVLVGKDYHALEVSCTNFIIDEPVLYFVVADMDKNLHLFQYAPYNVQSFAGQKLIRRGDFHVGAQVKTILSLPKKELVRRDVSFDQGVQPRWMEEENNGYKQLCLCGTLDGSIGIITPIPEKMYKRMQLLHAQMVNGLQHPAGLNPKSFRLLQSKQRLATNPAKGILDGDLLIQFPNLALHRQREMTKQIGTTIDRIMDDLLAVQESYDYF
ncbi:12053_t:CDS:10 [Acaulospora morrowiae]|uniref:12053_t:CDS:1 n=1 Tax=Acaulospora morrowiae TaxID=94023 RepID=A0A9N9C232_9GLOM|nr:12053_t:CDS:10 [Acaulospora morrowiae]